LSDPRRIKVLMLIDTLLPGGAERALVGLATSLPAERYEVTVCATRGGDGPLLEPLLAAGVRFETLGRSGRWDLAPFRRLVLLLREERYDILHAHKFGSNLWGSIVGRLSRTPVIVAHEHSWAYSGDAVRRLLDGQVIGRLSDVMVAVSTRDRERMTTVEGVPPAKTVYIPNAFVQRPPAPPEGDLRAELGISPGACVVGTLAVLRAEKRLDLMIDAFARVADEVDDAHLVVGGYGPWMEEWQAHAQRLGVGERVHWLGMREDVETVLRGVDVAAMSSEREGMPLFAFECMATRTPLVATDVGGLRDIFPGGQGAVLVPPGDVGALAEALASLVRDPERREAIAEAAHARLPEFSAERSAERVGELYQRLLAKRGVVSRPAAPPGAAQPETALPSQPAARPAPPPRA
jgi:glycosyltransferase involved in cell wall biosynthesis